MTPKHFDAVIVGAGPAGAAAAILLARAGWAVALVEKQAFPRRKVCGECVAASNLPLLDTLGVGAAFAARAGPELRRIELMQGDRSVTADLPAAEQPGQPWGRALGREALDTLLRDRARAEGAELLQPVSLRALGGSAGDWRCEVRAAGAAASLHLRAPVLIDAHGSWAELPAAADPARRAHRDADLFAFKANFGGAALGAGVISVLALDGGYGGMVVAGAGLATVACCIRRDRLQALRAARPGLAVGEAVQAWLSEQCAGVRGALEGARRAGPWLACGPIAPGLRVATRDGRWRIGNAAGEAHPILGEGMSMALQSAALLAAHLLRERPRTGAAGAVAALTQAEAQHRYADAWRRRFAPRVHLAAAFAQAAMRPAATALLMAGARAWPGLLGWGARLGGKVRLPADLEAELPAEASRLATLGKRATRA